MGPHGPAHKGKAKASNKARTDRGFVKHLDGNQLNGNGTTDQPVEQCRCAGVCVCVCV